MMWVDIATPILLMIVCIFMLLEKWHMERKYQEAQQYHDWAKQALKEKREN